MSKRRVAERVAQDGHRIPADVIERRFARSLSNFMQEFRYQATRTRCFMNGGAVPEPIFEQYQGVCTILHDEFFQWVMKESNP